MRIELSNATPLQIQIAEAFSNRHKASLSAFEISISLEAKRVEKLEGFSLSAKRNGTKVEATIGLTLEHSFRYALNALSKWLVTDEPTIELVDGPDFPVRGVVEGFYGKPWTHAQKLKGIEFFADYNMNTYFLPSSKFIIALIHLM